MEYPIRSGMIVMEHQDIFGQEIIVVTTSANVGLIEIVSTQIKNVIVMRLNSNNYLMVVGPVLFKWFKIKLRLR